MGGRPCMCSLFLFSLVITLCLGAPRHHHKPERSHDEKPKSKSYIDIDATDPFKVPKNSHYMEHSVPDDFDSQEAEGRATVEGEEQSPDEGENEQGGSENGGTEQSDSEQDGSEQKGSEQENPSDSPQEKDFQDSDSKEERKEEEGNNSEEGEQNGSPNSELNNGNGLGDLPAGITDKIDEMARNQGAGQDGKPIEINEKDLQNMMSNGGGGGGGEEEGN